MKRGCMTVTTRFQSVLLPASSLRNRQKVDGLIDKFNFEYQKEGKILSSHLNKQLIFILFQRVSKPG